MPEVSTSSLPDIIFMLLFFFMVVTVMKDSSLKVDVVVPEATELEKLEKKSLVSYIYIGEPIRNLQPYHGTAPRIQLNDDFAAIDDIGAFLQNEVNRLPEIMRPFVTASLRVDRDVTMGIVSDVKTELRKQNQLKINYSAQMRGKEL